MTQYSTHAQKSCAAILSASPTEIIDQETGEITPLPPSNNMGGKFPENLILSIDWLAFSCSDEHLVRLPQMLTDFVQCNVSLIVRPSGKFGFTESADIVALTKLGHLKLGIVAWGGDSQKQRCYISLTGSGCQSIASFSLVHTALEAIGATISRIDLALDDYDGKYSPRYAYKQYKAGAFTIGGRKPDYCTIGDWLEHTGKGRTLTIGTRGNGKFLRVYEKGRQLGDPSSQWTRWEYELTKKDREIPLAVLLNPLDYFAGCSPAAAALVKANPVRIVTRQRKPLEATLDRLVGHVRTHSGKVLNILREVAGGDAEKVLDIVAVKGIPGSLKSMPIVQGQEWVQLGINLLGKDDRQASFTFY